MDTIKQIIEEKGKTHQCMVAVEELSELQKAISKCVRGEVEQGEMLTSLYEEIADVEIMIEQLKYIFDIRKEPLDSIKDFKLRRVQERYLKEKEN